jgi:DNA-binding NtrC family response regulator
MKKATRKKILLVEDDKLFQQMVKDFLVDFYEVIPSESAESALDILRKTVPDLILLDIRLPEMDGIEALKRIKTLWPDIPILMLTAVDRVATVVEAMKLGAYDYLTKPLVGKELLIRIDRALESIEIKRELERRRKLQLATNKEYRLIGASAALEKVREQIQIAAVSDVTVLIQGETGTGKELVAREIHACSSRADEPFVAVNCGAIPKDLIESEFFGYKKGAFTGAQRNEVGKFQLADRGTLLLDEISELPLDAQTKLLRVLEEEEFYPVGSTELVRVDVRIIASTNKNLKHLMEQKTFREDLFFRLNVYPISIPPLRERPEDIIPLAEYFMERFSTKFGKNFTAINPEAKEILLKYPWRGNVRELRNVIERVVISEKGTLIEKEHLSFIETLSPIELSKDSLKLPEIGLDRMLEETEKRLLLEALKLARGSKPKAAELLKISPPSFYYRLEKYGLS